MKLYIKNKFVSIGGSSTVTDESGQEVFQVKGKAVSVTRKKYVNDVNGNLLYTVCNKWINLFTHSAYILDGNGETTAKVIRKFGFSNRFVVEGYKDEIAVEGDFLSWTLVVFRNGRQIGTVRRELFTLVDSFVLETDTEYDAAFMVALVIAIDNIFDNMSNSSN